MNVDLILSTFNERGADYILIGGMNFLLHHEPVTTFDVDRWGADTDMNLAAVHAALGALQAEVSFSPKGDDWRPVSSLGLPVWLRRAPLFCRVSPHGAIAVFRTVKGLEVGYEACRPQCPRRQTPTGVPYRSLSDELMIRCQLALPEAEQKKDRLRKLGYRPPA